MDQEIMTNPHLLNAARYIDAIHDIPVDENHPNLISIVEKLVEELESTQLMDYWRAYQQEINPEWDGHLKEDVLIEEKQTAGSKKPFFYRGAKLEETQGAGKKSLPKKGLMYRGQVVG
ncbi:MAG: hypothetical protein ACRBEE_12220 [Arenicella sp.]